VLLGFIHVCVAAGICWCALRAPSAYTHSIALGVRAQKKAKNQSWPFGLK
jgi:hypothetical protein